MVLLCDECVKQDAEGCEELAIGIITPGTCALCGAVRAKNAFKLSVLKEHWFNEGYGCGANVASTSYP
jgi:hypothetical protein